MKLTLDELSLSFGQLISEVAFELFWEKPPHLPCYNMYIYPTNKLPTTGPDPNDSQGINVSQNISSLPLPWQCPFTFHLQSLSRSFIIS